MAKKDEKGKGIAAESHLELEMTSEN